MSVDLDLARRKLEAAANTLREVHVYARAIGESGALNHEQYHELDLLLCDVRSHLVEAVCKVYEISDHETLLEATKAKEA